MNREAWEQRRRRDSEIIKALEKGTDPRQVAKDYNLSLAWIRSIAKPYALIRRRADMRKASEDLLRDFRRGTSEKTLAKKYNKSLKGVYDFLRSKIPDYVPPISRRIARRNQKIINSYQMGTPINQLVKDYKISYISAKGILVNAGLYTPLPTGRPRKGR